MANTTSKKSSGATKKTTSNNPAAKKSGGAQSKPAAKKPASRSAAPAASPRAPRDYRGLLAGLSCFLALFTVIGLFSADALFIRSFCGTLKGLIGYGYYLLPVALLAAAVLLLLRRIQPVVFRVVCLLLCPGVLGALVHVLANGGMGVGSGTMDAFYKALYESGQALQSGGLLGGLLGWSLRSLFSPWGAVPVLVFVLGALIVLAFRVSPRKVAQKLMEERRQRRPILEEPPLPKRPQSEPAAPERRREPKGAPVVHTAQNQRNARHSIDISLEDEPAAPVDEGACHGTQRLRRTVFQRRLRRNHARLEPGETLPLAPLHEQVFLQRIKRNGGRAGAAVGTQRQIHAEHEAVLRHLRQQRRDAPHGARKVFLHRNAPAPIGAPAAFAVRVVDINQINVAGHIQFARAQLAHAHAQERGLLPVFAKRRAATRAQFTQGKVKGMAQRQRRQLSHRARDHCERRALLAIQHHQPFHHKLAQHAQRRTQFQPAPLQRRQRGFHCCRVWRASGQQRQFSGITAAQPLHQTRMRRRTRCAGNRAAFAPIYTVHFLRFAAALLCPFALLLS